MLAMKEEWKIEGEVLSALASSNTQFVGAK